MKYFFCLLCAVALLALNPAISSAGFLDKINDATKKLNDYNAKQQSKQSGQTAGSNGVDEDHPIQLQGQGHCKGQNTATCMDYMEVVDQCMDPLKGYRSKPSSNSIFHFS